MRRSPLTQADFSVTRPLAGFEGGAVYTAERQGKFYIIQDESTMAGLLSEEDLHDLADSLVRVLEFDTPVEREAYIHERGWDSRAERKKRNRGG